MFSKKMFGDMRRAGMTVGLSKAKISKAMLEILVQLPTGTTHIKAIKKLSEREGITMGTCGRVEARNIHFIMPEKEKGK